MKVIFPTKSVLRRSAFSLMEVLVVVAVIGVMGGMAVPGVVRMTRQAEEGKDRANAQRLSLASGGAVAAGAVFGDLDSAVSRLTGDGGVVASRVGLGEVRFVVGGMTEEDVAGAKEHLQFEGGQLTLRP
jgi:prepilin-type N-terminal cleavage/methylation domain-containing protein